MLRFSRMAKIAGSKLLLFLNVFCKTDGGERGWLVWWMHRWIGTWMDGYMDGWMDGWMGTWMDGWMDG